jgi:hypothetical protein
MISFRKQLADKLDKRAARYAPRALVLTSLGFIVWPLLPVGVVYTVACLGAASAAKALRKW